MTGAWRDRSLADLLAEHELTDAPELPFPTDGWSGATFTRLDRGDGRRFVLKRTSLAIDWIARATRDADLREAWLAATVEGDPPFVAFGAAADGAGAAVLMPDLSAELIAWDQPDRDPVVSLETLDQVLRGLAALHEMPWPARGWPTDAAPPWCPLADRLQLLTPRSAAGYAAASNPVGHRFLAGWAAFERRAPAAATDLVWTLSADVTPLLAALARLPAAPLHGDLKLANVAQLPGDRVAFIDWQMTTLAPVAVELGWFLVSNSGSLPIAPDAVLDRYRAVASASDDVVQTADHGTDWAAQVDLTMIVGLLLRGWRKGLDAEADTILASGVAAADDCTWWCDRAVEAARRQL